MAHGISVPADGRAVARGPKRLLALRGDEHLVDRLRGGDETAFEVIYERHVPGILSFCRHMLGSREEAEDAVQQAFTAAHGDLLRDRREIRLKPWLYAIARNRCLSMLRARREQSGHGLEASTDGLHEEVERRADLRALVTDLQDLPEDQRAALVLSELRDLSHAEVAAVLGCKVANVKGLVFRARSGLGERRDARDALCGEIQEELATARGGALRRGRLRHHLRSCSACSGYLEQVRDQRKMMAAILPVIPTVGLKNGVLAAVGLGGTAAGGGAAAGGGGLLAALAPAAGGATVAKVAVVGALVAGGGGLAGEAVLDRGDAPKKSPPAFVPPSAAAVPDTSPLGRAGSPGAAEQERSLAKKRARADRARKRDERLARKRALATRRPGAGRRGAGRGRVRPVKPKQGEGGGSTPRQAPQTRSPAPVERLQRQPRVKAQNDGTGKRLDPLAPKPGRVPVAPTE